MSVLGAVSLEVELDFSPLDKQLQSLSGRKNAPLPVSLEANLSGIQKQLKQLPKQLDCIKVDLCPDVADFQEKLRRVGRISPIQVDICVDKTAIKSQFKEAGRYAAEGFSQGFGASGDIGKTAAESIVKNFKKELGIQSPSRVFRATGKDSYDGWVGGFKDNGQIKSVVKDLVNQFKNFEVELKVKAKGSAQVKVESQAQVPKVRIDNSEIFKSFESDLSSSIEKGFRAASKKSLPGLLLGGIGSIGAGLAGLVLLPIKAAIFTLGTIATGTLLKVGEDLSSGVSAGLKSSIGSALSSTVGNSTIVGEAIGEGIAESAEAVLKKLLPGILQELSQGVRQVLGEEKVIIATAARRSRQASSRQEDRELATQQIQQDYSNAVREGKPVRAKQLKSEISAVQPGIERDQQQFAAEYASEQQRLQKIAESFRVKLTPQKLIRRKVKEYEEQVRNFEKAAEKFEQSGQIGSAQKIRTAVAQLPRPNIDPTQISKEEIKFQEAKYLGEIQGKFVSRELNQKFQSRGINLAQRKRAIAPQLQEYGQLSQELGDIAGSANVLGINPAAKNPQQQILPAVYKKVFQEVAKLSGVGQLPVSAIPQLVASNNLRDAAKAAYSPTENIVKVRPETYERIQQGQLQESDLSVLIHELRHALQFGLGEANPLAEGASAIPLLSPTPEEGRKMGRFIEGSTSGQPEQLKPIVRKLESDAYVFEQRNSQQIINKLKQEKSVENFQSTFGVAGAKIESLSKNAQTATLKKVVSIQGLFAQYGLDIQEEIGKAIAQSDNLAKSLEPLLDKAANVEQLTTAEISELSGNIRSTLEVVVAQMEDIPNQFKAQGIAKLEQRKVAAQPSVSLKNQEKELVEVRKRAFKGSPKNRVVLNEAEAANYLNAVQQVIISADEEGKKEGVSSQERQTLGQLKGRMERNYRAYSPALRKRQKENLLAPVNYKQSASPQPVSQAQLFSTGDISGTNPELFSVFSVFDDLENNLNAVKQQLNKLTQRGKNIERSKFIRKARQTLKISKDIRRETINFEAKIQEERRKENELANTQLTEIEKNIDPSLPTLPSNEKIESQVNARNQVLQGIRRKPIKFLKERSKTAVVQKARYLTENAESLALMVGSKVGDEPNVRQSKSLLNLQDAFGNLGQKAVKFGQTQSDKDFKLLNAAVKELESSLRRLGIPFELINHQIDNYTDSLKKMQAEGKIDIDVDVDSLAPEKFSFIDNILAKFSDLEIGGLKSIGGLVKGFAAFTVVSVAQNFLQNLAQDAFKAYVELDRLKTALNFASGGSAAGGQNLAFVRKTVEDLKIPLKASTEGFVQLESAARGSALAGKGSRELFTGISQASTVLSLSADQSQGAILALSQMISKGKVNAEELRGQLGERIPGALGIAARAMGVTEQEFSRLLDTGSIISQDFLPKFAKQLQAEFGDASKDAAGNAQSAIFDLENSILSLQQGIGEGVAPAAVAGLNVFTGLIKGVSSVGRELGFILLGITAALAVKMVVALQAVVAQLIATKLATGTLGGGLASLAQTINTSFSTQLTVGIFAVLELINLLNQAVNTELVQSFDKAAKSAQRSAEASRKAFEKSIPGQKKQVDAESSSGFGRFADDYLIKPGRSVAKSIESNKALNAASHLIPGRNLFMNYANARTYGENERENVGNSIGSLSQSTSDFLASAQFRLAEFRTRSGSTGELPGIDAELQAAEQKRQILQAQIKRDFVDKGVATPAASKRELEVQNLALRELNDKRAEIAKPFSLDLSRTDQQINSIKAQIESLNSPEAIALFGEEGANKQQDQLNQTLEALKRFKTEAESALASLKIDPVRAFTQSLREMNLALAENQEKNELKFTERRSAIATKQLAGFSTDKFASKRAAREQSEYEYERSQANLSTLEEAVQKGNKTINASNFQSTLRRLGISPDATSAKIEDVLKNTTDEADKGILENLKSVREQRNKLPEARLAVTESRQKLKQQNQEDFLFNIDENAAYSRATTSKEDNRSVTSIKNAQIAKVLVEEVANEKIAAIQLKTTRKQQKFLDEQLTKLRNYYGQGEISAEEFAKRERDLTVEQSNLEKQEAENRVAAQSATKERRLKSLEIANKKAENAISFAQIGANTNTKLGILSGDIGQEASQQQQNQAEQESTISKIALIKKQIADTKKLREEGILDARDATDKETALNIELAQSNQQLIDQQIQAQENLRAAIEKTFQRREQQLDLENSQQDTQAQSDSLTKFESSPEIDLRGLELETSGKGLENRSSLLASQIALVQEQLTGVDALGLAEQEASDKKRELSSRLDKLTKEQIQNRKDQITNQQEREVNGIERLQKAEENRFKLATSAIDQQKTALDLYSQSLDRTSKLEESRQNLSKALSDAALTPLETRRDSASRALDLSRRLKDDNLDPSVKGEINRQLSQSGFGSTELEILNQRAAIEDEIAAKKLESLKLEQEYQRKSLSLDLQRQKIAAQMAVYDAESGQLSAAKSRLDAESALKIAQIKKDDTAIESAKVALELAWREISLSDKRLNNAILGLSLQEEAAGNATQAQQATQGSAIAQQMAAESARQQATALEKVEASVKEIATSKADSASTGTEGWKNPYDRLTLEEVAANKKAAAAKKNIKHESDFDYYSRLATLKMTGQIQEVRRTTNTLDESGFDRGSNAPTSITPPVVNLPPSVQTYAPMPIQPQTGENLFEAYMRQQSAKPPQPEGQNVQIQKEDKLQKFTDGLQAEISKIAGKLDALITNMTNIAARPSVLQVSSPNAVSDAADIYSNISKNAVRSSGI